MGIGFYFCIVVRGFICVVVVLGILRRVKNMNVFMCSVIFVGFWRRVFCDYFSFVFRELEVDFGGRVEVGS